MNATIVLILLATAPRVTDSKDAIPRPGEVTDGKRPVPTPTEMDAFWKLEWVAGPSSGLPRTRPPSSSKRLRQLGASLYRTHCAGCHGEGGDGKGPLAAHLRISPTAFIHGMYRLRSTPSPSIPTDTDLFTTLTRGVHGTPMYPWNKLTEYQRWALVQQLKTFSARFQQERPLASIQIPTPPQENDVLRERGKKLYAFLECAKCHGDSGAGDGPATENYHRTEPNRDVPIRDFTRGQFIRGTEMEDIFLTLKAGLDGTPMASYQALLRDDEIWAVAAYVRSLIQARRIQDFPPARQHASNASPHPASPRQ